MQSAQSSSRSPDLGSVKPDESTAAVESVSAGKDKYRLVGPVYDLLSAFYSGKAIHASKIAMLGSPQLEPGQRVLFAGAGHGKDAIHAVEQGADVTVIDLSKTMLRKLDEELTRRGKQDLPIRRLQADIFKFDELGQYDMVVGNFFLNVFDEKTMPVVLEKLIALAKDSGSVVVGDFALPKGNLLKRLIQKFYWYVAVSLFWLTAGNALHRIYDYPAAMQKAGLEIKSIKRFSFMGLANYWSILGKKQTSTAVETEQEHS